MGGVNIRRAEIADVPQILMFIHELADYEHLTHAVIATEESLCQTLFGHQPYAEVLFAEVDEEAVGFALFFHNYSTFLGQPGIYLEDLYVRSTARSQGIGRRLLTHVARLAVARGCGRLEWSVLHWNEPAIGFYRRLGARPLDDWTLYRLTGPELAQLGKPQS